jgi:hypothetical protein
MKLSSREKFLLSALLLVGIIASFYYLLYTPQMEKIADLEIRLDEVIILQNEMKNQISNSEQISEDFKIKLDEVNTLSSRFRPGVLQEKVIYTFEDVLISAGINGENYSYTVNLVEDKKEEENQESSNIKEIKEKFINYRQSTTIDSKISGLDNLQAIIGFSTTHINFLKNILNMDNHPYYVVVNAFSYSLDQTTGNVDVSLDLAFPAYPKLDESMDTAYIEKNK